MGSVPLKKGQERLFLHHMRTRGDAGHPQARTWVLARHPISSTSILDVQPPDLSSERLLLEPPSVVFATAP